MCPRCKAPAHGGPCGAPVPLAPEPVRAGAARAIANMPVPVKRAPDARAALALAKVDACARHIARLYGYTTEQREAWRLDFMRAIMRGDTGPARIMALELDPSERRDSK